MALKAQDEAAESLKKPVGRKRRRTQMHRDMQNALQAEKE